MRPFLLHIICIVMLFSSCNWVNDDLSDCPTGTWLKISYTYNILDVDAASSQVGDITIFAFDKNNKYVDRLDVDSIALHQGYCMVRVPFPEGSYHLLLWGGASDRQYRFPYLKTGQTERKSLLLSLICNSEKQMNGKLKGLFYGSLENITISNDYQVLDAPLVKNTNYFSCILQDDNNLLNQEDFTFTLEAANGVMDHTNTPLGTEPVYYRPYRQEVSILDEEETPVIHARLNTLRIMKGDQTTLTIKHVPSGQEILRLPLTQYLLLSKIHSHTGDEMGDQEYLDRQDSYTLLFFIQSSDMGIPKICPRIMVNGWTVRLNDSELEF